MPVMLKYMTEAPSEIRIVSVRDHVLVLAGVALTPTEIHGIAQGGLDAKQLEELDRELYPGWLSKEAILTWVIGGVGALIVGAVLALSFAWSGTLLPHNRGQQTARPSTTVSTQGTVRDTTTAPAAKKGLRPSTTQAAREEPTTTSRVPTTTTPPSTVLPTVTTPETLPTVTLPTITVPTVTLPKLASS